MTNAQSLSSAYMDQPKTSCPTGPADYEINRIIGQPMAQASIRNEPQYSFTKSLTHRTTESGGNISNRKNRTVRRGKCFDQDAVAIGNFFGSPSRGTGADRDSAMLFHKTNDLRNPGVGDYSIAKPSLDATSRSPRPTIGNERRFREPPLREFVVSTPHQYMADA